MELKYQRLNTLSREKYLGEDCFEEHLEWALWEWFPL